ncbi:NUDIX domain-containing protein [Neorhizobium alkalisoli]|uniref:GDP-mannose pyrophosphatase n=1 Tax=Neorhizobium alkalisoli TaxID=528178 RepID=A0A561R2J0_9HYPH|nr:NUDIX domain-containing protein [Neorhizobium alkalisoli]TWF56773.1 nudix-type nucleoside diphosphatase (YffH/AdpP family) [Neorhizobium alkalisoli]
MTDNSDRVKIVSDKTLSNGWTRLSSYELDYTDRKGDTHRIHREIFHRTPAACILLHDVERDTVVLVKQFRLPAHLAGEDDFMIEVPAGLLDGDTPEEAIRREAMEETGFRVRDVKFVFKALMSPGAVTEVVHFFHAEVDLTDRVEEGGGLAEEHEDIEVLEVPLDDALAMIEDGRIIDAKTIMMLQWARLQRG